MARKEEGRNAIIMFTAGRSSLGKPRIRWMDKISKDLELKDVSMSYFLVCTLYLHRKLSNSRRLRRVGHVVRMGEDRSS